MVHEILDYIKTCPYLSNCNFNIDFLGKNPYSLSICGRAKSETVRKYTDGDSLVMRKFPIRIRLPFGVDMEKNRKNSQLCENISRWFEENGKKGHLPDLGDENIAVSASFEFSSQDASYSADTAVFTASLAVLYYKTKSL